MQQIWDLVSTGPQAEPWLEVLVRLLAACLFGGLIGIEREWRTKPAGLRTHIMVAAGSCLFCLLTLELLLEAETTQGDSARADPIRVIEAVTAGIAFLAAGSILTSGGNVTGLTTGAGLWVAGAIGVASGLGQIALAAVATALVLVVLTSIRLFERPRDAAERRADPGPDAPRRGPPSPGA